MSAISSDFFVAEPARAKDYLVSKEIAEDDRADWEGISPSELSTLHAIVDGREWEKSSPETFVRIATTADNRRAIHELPSDFIERLARLTTAELETATAAWAQTEGMSCDEAAAQPVIRDLINLSQNALASRRRLYLWTEMPETAEAGGSARVISATEFESSFASKEVAFDRSRGWAVGEHLYYRCPSCRDVLTSRPARRLRCRCHGVQIAPGGGVQAKDPTGIVLLRATPWESVRETDLSALALSMGFVSIGYALLAAAVVAVTVIIASIARLNFFTNRHVWPLIAVIWAVLEIRLVLKLWRTAQLTLPVRGTSRALHQFEFTAAGFLLLFALTRPYLAGPEASAFPTLRLLFESFIGIVVFCHVLVLALFKVRPNKWDVASLSASAAGVVSALL